MGERYMNILINQLGYACKGEKYALLRGEWRPEVQVLDGEGRTVLTAPVSRKKTEIWGDQVMRVDFSALQTPGNYTLRCGEEASHPFPVTEKPYQGCLNALVDMFYYQRCGDDLDDRIGPFAHPACHAIPARIYGTDDYMDASGGWHDAGDYGRYIVPAAKAAADLVLAWQWNRDAFVQPNLTALPDELRWELEWMLKMQRADGGVYHKVSCVRFCPMIMPQEEIGELIVSPVSTTATGDFAACMAMASRMYRAIDAAFADRMLAAARQAWDFLAVTEPILFRNPEGISTGGYGDHSDADERLWAHVELAVTTGEKKYLAAAWEALQRMDRSYAILGWADVSGYAAFSGLQLSGEMGEMCRAWVLHAADGLLSRINAYGITMTEKLPWGSNMIIANDGMMLAQAYRLTGDEKYRQGAEKQLHYLLGVNPVDYCYVTGFGSRPVCHPHHRPSVALNICQPGMLSGGAAAGLMDACARENLQGQPAGKCFIDRFESYSTNEICVYWNSPLVALLAEVIRNQAHSDD